MVEGSPMVRNEKPRAQSFEEHQSIITRQVAATEAWFPPWRITNREESNVELLAFGVEHVINDLVCAFRESRISREETAHATTPEQIHVSRTSPLVDAIAGTAMHSRGAVDRQLTKSNLLPRGDGFRLAVTRTTQPLL